MKFMVFLAFEDDTTEERLVEIDGDNLTYDDDGELPYLLSVELDKVEEHFSDYLDDYWPIDEDAKVAWDKLGYPPLPHE